MALRLRTLTTDETSEMRQLAHSRTAPARTVERAQIMWQSSLGKRVPTIARELRLSSANVRLWLTRLNANGLAGLADGPRPGPPKTSTPEQVSALVAAVLAKPTDRGLPFACWTLDRLVAYLTEEEGISLKRSRVDEILIAEGLLLAPAGDLVRRAGGPRLRQKKGAIVRLYEAPPAGSVVICVDKMGPAGAKSFLGRQPVLRATQEIDYGRRGKGYMFGAFRPPTGAAFTATHTGRTIANWVTFLEHVEG